MALNQAPNGGMGSATYDDQTLRDLTKFDAMTELGATGLKQSRGYTYEEYLTELTGENGRRTFRQMIDGSAIIGAYEYAVEMLCRQVQWGVNPASPSQEDMAAAEFVQQCVFEDQSVSWNETLSEIITFVWWGWEWSEIVWKRRLGPNPGSFRNQWGETEELPSSKFNDGKVGIRKLAARGQETLLHWIFDKSGGTRGMVQLPPPTYERRTIPIEKALLFRTVNRKGNPEGKSVLRNLYESYYSARNLNKIEAVGVERDLVGVPVGRMPSEYFDGDAPAARKAQFAHFQQELANIRNDEQGYVLLPSDRDDKGNYLFDLSLLSTGGTRSFDTDAIIGRHEQRMATSLLADFILIGAKGAGSLALARTKVNLFSVALGAFLDHIAEVINQHLLPRLFALNGWQLDRLPEITHSKVAAFPLEDLAAYLTALAGSKVPLIDPTDELKRYLLELADLPVPQAGAVDGDESEPSPDADVGGQPAPEDQGEGAAVDVGQAVGASERRWSRRLWLPRGRRN